MEDIKKILGGKFGGDKNLEAVNHVSQLLIQMAKELKDNGDASNFMKEARTTHRFLKKVVLDLVEDDPFDFGDDEDEVKPEPIVEFKPKPKAKAVIQPKASKVEAEEDKDSLLESLLEGVDKDLRDEAREIYHQVTSETPDLIGIPKVTKEKKVSLEDLKDGDVIESGTTISIGSGLASNSGGGPAVIQVAPEEEEVPQGALVTGFPEDTLNTKVNSKSSTTIKSTVAVLDDTEAGNVEKALGEGAKTKAEIAWSIANMWHKGTLK